MNCRYLSLALAPALLAVFAASAQHATGAVFNPTTIAETPQKVQLSLRSFQGLPSSYSLEPWCPTPADQGQHGTCVAFANAYAVATILYAKTHGISNRALIDKYAFSPTFLYEQIKNPSDKDCQEGSDPIRALVTMATDGDALQKTVPYACGTALSSSAKSEAANYKIKDANLLFAGAGLLKDDKYVLPEDQMVAVTKKALAEGTPISTGWFLPESFFAIKSEVWNTLPNDPKGNWKHSGHAMAIVGYDDNKYGGSFRVMNSWGTGWADHGFVWVRYSDFSKWCVMALQVFADPLTPKPTELQPKPEVVPDPKPAPAPSPAPAPAPVPTPKPAAPAEHKFILSGDVSFQLNTGEEMRVNKISSRNLTVDDDKPAVKEDLVAYTMSQGYPSGTGFRFYLNVDHEAYVYAFATDLSGKVNLILPFDDKISTHVGANSSIAFPSDSKVVRLDENSGTDYLLILYSAEKLDASKLAQDMNAMTGALSEKIRKALGKKLMDKSVIKYAADKVAFGVNGSAALNLTVSDDNKAVTYTGGTVVPLMVEIKHTR